MYHGDTFEHKDHTFIIQIEHDEAMGEPWKEHDGHGVVSEWTTRAKRPGERILTQDRQNFRYYDIQATTVIAKRDGWGVPCSTLTAVELDFSRMKAWCNDEWHWIYISVTLLDDDGNKTKYASSLGGMESDAGEYLNELARECADECLSDYHEYLETVLA